MLDKTLEQQVLEIVNTLSKDFKIEFAGKISQITALSKRIPLTRAIEQLVIRDLDQLSKRHKEALDIPAQSKTKSDQIAELIEKFKKEKLHLAGTIQDELLGYAESILGSLVDSEYGQSLIFELQRRLSIEPFSFSSLLELVHKLDANKTGVSKESLLYFIDIVSGNFEYYEYDKWVKITSQDLKEVRTQAAILLRSVVKEVQKLVPELSDVAIKSYHAEMQAIKSDKKWLPQKFVERRNQEARDTEIARKSIFDTLQYYFLDALKAQRDFKSTNNKKKRRECGGAIIRNISNLKLIMQQNQSHMTELLRHYIFRERIINLLTSLTMDAEELVQIVLNLTRQLLQTENEIHTKQNILHSIRLIPNAVGYLHKDDYTAEEILFLSKVVSEHIPIPELLVMKKKDLELCAGSDDKIVLLSKFKTPEDRAFLLGCYRSKDEKLDTILLPEVMSYIKRDFITTSQIKKWNAAKMINIIALLLRVKTPDANDSERLSKLYDQSREAFNRLAANSSLEALGNGYCSVTEAIANNSESRHDVLFSNNSLKGYRLGLFTFQKLVNCSTEDIKLLTHSNAQAAIRKGGARFETLLRILKNDRPQFFFLTSADAKQKYENGICFEQRLEEYGGQIKKRVPIYYQNNRANVGISV